METIEERTFNEKPDKVFKILLESLGENFAIKRIEKDVKTVVVSTGMSLLSFGENLEIIVADNGHDSIVRIRGSSKVKWNITSDIDEKIKQIFELLNQRL